MSKLRQWVLSLTPSPLRGMLRSFRDSLRGFRGKCDRIYFPIWLVFQCAIRRQRAVVIWRTAALGDIVCTLPLCGEIRKRHPDALLVYITARFYRDIILLSRETNLVYAIDHVYGARSWIGSASRHVFGLITQIYEPLTGDERSTSAALACHLVEDLGNSCGITISDRQPRLYPSEELKQRVQSAYGLREDLSKGHLLIGINGGRTWPVREWEAAKWQTIIEMIHAEYDAVVLQFGHNFGPPDDYDQLEGVVRLVNRLSAKELVALIGSCHLIVSIDSGPIHVAGALNVPTVGLFGAVDPRYRLPVSSPAVAVVGDVPCLYCHHRTPAEHWKNGCPHDIACMKALDVGQVFQAIRDMLAKFKSEVFITQEPRH